jgi:energy-coupling factor transporter ATP-binding protein EcfA2
MTYKEKIERVENVISVLGLESCRNTYIGNSQHRVISGGERKRVSIGIELVTDPQILFLDEPTSGLDAFTALNIIKTIKDFAISERKIVLMTIHQPRTDILNLIDKVFLVSMGQCVWFGPSKGALEHFAGLGYSIPLRLNPSDFYLDITTLDQRTDELRFSSKARIDTFVSAFQKKAIGMDGMNEQKIGTQAEPHDKRQWASTISYEIWVLWVRYVKDALRDKLGISALFGANIFMLVVIGFIFFRLGNSTAGIQSKIGFLFFITINQTFGVISPFVNKFVPQRPLVKRERAAGTYRAIST